MPTLSALVTGGARGIGLETAWALIQKGWQVAIADRDPPTESDITADPRLRQMLHIRMDVADTPSVDRGIAQVQEHFGALDGLVNAAGYNHHEPVSAISDAVWQSLFEVHLGGTLRCCRAALPALRSSRAGAVVNFSSVAGRRGRPNRGAYSAAKAGIEALTRTMAVEWAPEGIRVNAVVPGWINTRLMHATLHNGQTSADSVLKAIPLARFGEPAEVAQVATFLLSTESSYMTGQSLVIDGGALINGKW